MTAARGLFDEMAAAAEDESPLWAARCGRTGARAGADLLAARARGVRARARDGLRGLPRPLRQPRLFAPGEESERVLLGDYLYAHGLVRISEAGGVDAVADDGRADLALRVASRSGRGGDGEAWIAAARALGGDPIGDEIAAALRRHASRTEVAGRR